MNISINDPSLAEFFDDDLFNRLNQPTDEGSALPNSAYTSEAYYKLEQQRVFRRTWVFALFAHQLKNTGDMVPVEIAGQPLVIVLDENDEIRAFHNVCRHRGAKLVKEPLSKCRQFTCPNHAWSYSLKGGLIGRPHFFGGDQHDINRADSHRADLVPVRCEVWHDWVFVNIDGEAPDIATYLEPIENRIKDYDFGQLEYSDKLEFEIRANWKLAIENFIEPYHVFSCHPWLNSFVSMAERSAPTFDRHILTCGYEFQKTDPARGEGLPYFPNLSDPLKKRGDWYVLFPNFAFEIFPDQVDVFISIPVSAGECRETIALYFNGKESLKEEYKEARQTVIDNWHDLNQEDMGVIERMQAGRSSEGFDGGVLSPFWDPVLQHYARLIFDSMQLKPGNLNDK